jgi:adenylate cyclase
MSDQIRRETAPKRSGPRHAPDTLRSWRVWRTSMREELVAPANAILELADLLLHDARHRGQHDFLADLEKTAAAARKFLALVDELFEQPWTADTKDEVGKKVRHELRTPLNAIIGYGDLWLEEAADQLPEGLTPDLQQIVALGRRLNARLDDMLEGAQAQEATLAAAQSAAEVVRCLPTVCDASRQAPAVAAGRILLADDNEINRDLIGRMLRREGHAIDVVSNGREALTALRARPYDLVLLDILMPELNGFQVLQALKADEQLRHVPVVMVSSFTEIDTVVCCIEMGAEDYVVKPFNPVVLRARINSCLEKKRFRDREALYLKEIEQERQRSDELLHVILPGEVVTELKTTNCVQPRRYENVAVLFADIVGFTPYCDSNAPEQVMPHLQSLIEQWEEIAVRHAVEKIKTIGDAFMAAAGLLQRSAEPPVQNCIRCGLEMQKAAQALPTRWDIRIGINFGPVMAGIIGRRQYLFDLWGDTVNTAARMESQGVAGAITLSAQAWAQVAHCCRGESLGTIKVKGKGPMEMFRFCEFLSGS